MTATIAAAGREWTVDGRQEDWAATIKAAKEANRMIPGRTIDGEDFTVAAAAVAWVEECVLTRVKVGFA